MIEIAWDDPAQTLIRWYIHRGYTWGEFDDAINQSRALMETVEHRVDLLVVAETQFMPTPAGLFHFRRALTTRPSTDNAGVLALVNPETTIKRFIDIVVRMYGNRTVNFDEVRYFTSEDAARAHIAVTRPSPQHSL